MSDVQFEGEHQNLVPIEQKKPIKIAGLMMRLSGGLIKDERKAVVVLAFIALVVIIFAIYFSFRVNEIPSENPHVNRLTR